jgi:hypothetical protein
MFIPSSKKDVVLTIIICALTLVLALTWRSKQIAVGELEIAKYKLSSCQDDLKLAKEKNQSLKEISNKSLALSEKLNATFDKTTTQHIAIMDMMYRRIKNGEVPEPIVREYLQIVKQ